MLEISVFEMLFCIFMFGLTISGIVFIGYVRVREEYENNKRADYYKRKALPARLYSQREPMRAAMEALELDKTEPEQRVA